MTTLGMRGTGSFAADHRPVNYREKYLMLEPNGSAPLTAILSMLPSEATDDQEFHNFRKDLPSFTFTHSGAVSGTSASGASKAALRASEEATSTAGAGCSAGATDGLVGGSARAVSAALSGVSMTAAASDSTA